MAEKYRIAYWLRTDIQHFSHICHIYERFGGVILTKNPAIFEFVKGKYAGLKPDIRLVKNSREAIAVCWRENIKLVIYTGFQFLHWGYGVQVFHGASDKTYIETPKILQYDMLLLPGRKHRDKLENAGLYRHPDRFRIVGYPKFDKIVNSTAVPPALFDNGRPVILYAPTWVTEGVKTQWQFSPHGESSLPRWGLDLVRRVPEKYNLIIKYHFRTRENPSRYQDAIQRHINDHGLHDQARTVWDADIGPYMQMADAMISDISAVCYEWFHLDRPILFANPSPEHYRPSDDPFSNTYAWRAGDVLNTADDILPALERNLTGDRYRDIRNELLHYAFDKADGKAGERQAEAIRELYRRVKHRSRPRIVLHNLVRSAARPFSR